MEIEHFSHDHPLILCEVKNDDLIEVFCSACSQMITGSAYGCVRCFFFLHNRCAEVPREIIHPMHPSHPLILLARARYNYNGVKCEVCQNIVSGFTYHCSLCLFAIDVGCAMRELSDEHERNKHPLGRRIGHEHLLILTEGKNDDSEEINCDRCKQNISGSAYSCRNCHFFLHKLCATLPLVMKHPMHPDQLTIQERSDDSVCEVCKQNVHGCAYHCSNSNFVVDISCAVRSQSVDHTNHDHPLNPMLSPALFDCHACGTKHAGLSYVCNTCKFWIHEDCFLLPTSVKHSGHHDHFLNLLDSFPYESSEIGYTCGICRDDMNKNCWIYRCGPCKYFVHVHCSAKTREGKIVFKREELDVGNLIRLPLANESSDLIDQFVSQYSKGANERKERDRFFPFIHEHPLTISKSELSTLNEQKINAKVCNACMQPISASSFYSCRRCSNFFIHKWCAYLPKDLKHECHGHPLSLKIPSPENSRFFHCECCKSSCNGFSFECFECGDYCLDVKCASLPIYILHEAHNDHPLLLRNNRSTKACAACAEDVKEFSFGCRTCDFDLHHKCASLPRTFTHRYDEHPFILSYAAIEDGPDEYYCEFCEEEMDPKRWFYHCVDCDQSACANCICKEPKSD